MDDLLNRLRTVDPPGGNEHSTRWHRNPDGPKAADRIETLEAEVERLRADLRVYSGVLWRLHAAHAITLDNERVLELLRAVSKYQRRLEAHESNHDDDSDPLDALRNALSVEKEES